MANGYALQPGLQSTRRIFPFVETDDTCPRPKHLGTLDSVGYHTVTKFIPFEVPKAPRNAPLQALDLQTRTCGLVTKQGPPKMSRTW